MCVCVSTVGKSVVLVSKWVTTIPTPEDGMTKCTLERTSLGLDRDAQLNHYHDDLRRCTPTDPTLNRVSILLSIGGRITGITWHGLTQWRMSTIHPAKLVAFPHRSRQAFHGAQDLLIRWINQKRTRKYGCKPKWYCNISRKVAPGGLPLRRKYRSVPCRTQTASSGSECPPPDLNCKRYRSQCSLPDSMSKLRIRAFPAGPQLQALDRGVPCRTRTASSGSECPPPDLNCKR